MEDIFKAIDAADRGRDGVELEKLLMSSQPSSPMMYTCDEVFFSSPYREHNREYNDDDKKLCF